jgi:hypothetical protein
MKPALVASTVILLCLARAGLSQAAFAALESRSEKAGSLVDSPSSPQLIDCSDAVALQVGSSIQASTVGLVSNVDSYGCSQWPETGGDIVYALSLAAPTMFEIRLTAACDLDIALLDACDPDLSCLLVADTGIQTTNPVMGDFFIVVDGYGGAACDFTLDIVGTDPASVDLAACQTAIPLSCASGPAFTGDTCLGNDYLRALGCELFPSAGVEQWYRLTVQPGGSFQVDLAMPAADAVLWILGGCGDAPECLDYSDAGAGGEQESVSYTNDGAVNRTVFLVVDSYGPTSCGGYDANLTCSGVIVPTQSSSWAALKVKYNREER